VATVNNGPKTQTGGPRTGTFDATRSGRHLPPPEPIDDGEEVLQPAGVLLLALAALELVLPIALAYWHTSDIRLAGGGGRAAIYAIIGLTLLQPTDGGRKATATFATLTLIGMAALFGPAWYFGFVGGAWPEFASVATVLIGVFILNGAAATSKSTSMAGLGIIAAGAIGAVASAILLAGAIDAFTIVQVVQWTAPLPAFVSGPDGLTVRPTAAWALLKPDNPLGDKDKPMADFASRRLRATAQLMRGSSGVESLDAFLDGVARPVGTQVAGFQSVDRRDITIGGVTGRRLKAAWLQSGVAMTASISGWQDADTFYALDVSGPRSTGGRLDEEAAALERTFTLLQPWTRFLADKGPAIAAACPLLTDNAMLTVARVVKQDSPPETFCREGYRLAAFAQAGLEADVKQRLTQRMRAFFNAVPAARRDAFANYVDRLRAGQPPTPQEDAMLTDSIRRALAALPPTLRDGLREDVAMAIAIGQFSESLGK